MHIRYIGHAGLALDVAGQHLLCDPWWNGPAYTGQWQAYPLPRFEKADLEGADFIYISHGHEDHLHIPTLRSIDKRAAILIPKHRDPGLRDSLQSMGFARSLSLRSYFTICSQKSYRADLLAWISFLSYRAI